MALTHFDVVMGAPGLENIERWVDEFIYSCGAEIELHILCSITVSSGVLWIRSSCLETTDPPASWKNLGVVQIKFYLVDITSRHR